MKKTILSIAVLALPMVVAAHPGHGHENPLSPGHYVGNPEHALPLALTIAAVLLFAGWAFRRYQSGTQENR